jgi:hypothetical protein
VNSDERASELLPAGLCLDTIGMNDGNRLTRPVGKIWGEVIMLYIRCTKKMIDELARNGHSLAGEPNDIPVLREWYANIFAGRDQCNP